MILAILTYVFGVVSLALFPSPVGLTVLSVATLLPTILNLCSPPHVAYAQRRERRMVFEFENADFAAEFLRENEGEFVA